MSFSEELLVVVRVCLLHSKRFNIKADKGVDSHSLLGHLQICRCVLDFSFTEDLQKRDIPKEPFTPKTQDTWGMSNSPIKSTAATENPALSGGTYHFDSSPKATTDYCCSRFVLWVAAFNLAVLPEALCTCHFMTPREQPLIEIHQANCHLCLLWLFSALQL